MARQRRRARSAASGQPSPRTAQASRTDSWGGRPSRRHRRSQRGRTRRSHWASCAVPRRSSSGGSCRCPLAYCGAAGGERRTSRDTRDGRGPDYGLGHQRRGPRNPPPPARRRLEVPPRFSPRMAEVGLSMNGLSLAESPANLFPVAPQTARVSCRGVHRRVTVSI